MAIEESNPPRTAVLEQDGVDAGRVGGTADGGDSHTRADGIRAGLATATEKTRDAAGKVAEVAKEKVGDNPHVGAVAEKTRSAVDRAVGAAHDQVDQHRVVAATVERTVSTSGKAARATGQQVRRHPRLAGGLAAGGAVLLTARRTLRRRRRPSE